MAIVLASLSVLALMVMPHVLGRAAVPEGYVLNVEQDCGAEGTNTTLSVETDLDVNAEVKCLGDHVYNFTSTDLMLYRASVYFDGNAAEKCVFTKRLNASVYMVEVIVHLISVSSDASINREVRYIMSCSYDEKGSYLSNNRSIEEMFHAAKAVHGVSGDTTQMGVSVLLTDILGQPIDTSTIPIDKILCLKVYLDNSTGLLLDGNLSPYPVSCEAVGSTTGHRHAIIRAGCGDGLVFSKDDGFAMKPRVAISPYFRLFQLENDKTFHIMCNFTLCANCAGKNSCTSLANSDRSIFELFGEWIEKGNKMQRLSPGAPPP